MRLARYVPALDWGRRYSGHALSSDLLAAVIVTIMLIPQSLAYALLAGLPPQMGLYASILPLVGYALFGSSRVLAVGPVAVAGQLMYFAGRYARAREHLDESVQIAREGCLDEWVARVLQPIVIAEPCLACHGAAETIAPAVTEVLAARYPNDRATGYALGDMRGAAWAEVAVAGR